MISLLVILAHKTPKYNTYKSGCLYTRPVLNPATVANPVITMILVAGESTLVFATDGLFWRNPARTDYLLDKNTLTVDYKWNKSRKCEHDTNIRCDQVKMT